MTLDYEVEEIRRKLDTTPLNEVQKSNFIRAYVFSSESGRRRIRKVIENLAQPFTAFNALPLSQPPAPPNDIILGKRMLGPFENGDFGINRESLTRSIAIMAPPGHGKTNQVTQIISQVAANQIPQLVFDNKKDTRYALHHLPSMIVINARTDLRADILTPPPGISQFDWLVEVSKFLAPIWGFYQIATGSYFLEILLEESEKKRDRPITLYDIKQRLHSENIRTHRKSEWHDVLTNRIDSTLRAIGPTIATNGFPIHELFDKLVVLELFDLRETEAKVIIAWFLAYDLLYRRARNERGRLVHFIHLDEAGDFLNVPYEWSQSIGDSILETFPRIARDFGIGVCYSFQLPSQIHNGIIANTDLKIAGPMGSGRDLKVVADAMNLSDDEIERLQHLPVGCWLAKTRSSDPVIIKAPLIERQIISDSDVAERMKSWKAKFRSFETRAAEQPEIIPELTNYELLFLKAVSEHPFEAKSELYNSMPGKRTTKVTLGQTLVNKRVLRVEKVQLFSSKSMEFFVPTSMGTKLMYANNFVGAKQWYAVTHSNHTFAHSLIIFHSWRIMRNYGDVRFEHKLPETRKQLDLSCQVSTRRVGVEVYSSPVVDAENVASCLPHLDMLFMVCLDTGILGSIKRAIEVYGISDNPKLRYYPNPYSFFGAIRSRQPLYNILSTIPTEPNPQSGTQDENSEN